MFENIVPNFRERMRDTGWTQTQAAKALDVDQSLLSRVFSGEKKPSKELLFKMAEVLRYGRIGHKKVISKG